MSRRRRGGGGRRRGSTGKTGGGGIDPTILPASAVPTMRGAPRRDRVERDLVEALTGALGGLRDPRLGGRVTVTRVELTDDLSFARVYVRPPAGSPPSPYADAAADHSSASGATPPGARDMMRGLDAATGRLRTEVAQALGLRRAPDLKFVYDRGQENAARVEALLAEIRADEGVTPSRE
ncbi:MAG: ribosome-binding factor A [Myxococcota bacterium]